MTLCQPIEGNHSWLTAFHQFLRGRQAILLRLASKMSNCIIYFCHKLVFLSSVAEPVCKPRKIYIKSCQKSHVS
ncbi:hypothetical protein OIU78_009667 [Salix suchowensis]|nr:hypothetical protein OIU78_009667 [Salix suchowensis]